MEHELSHEDETSLGSLNVEGISLADVEKMSANALRDALQAVIRKEPSVADHQDHGSHSNSNTGT